MKRLQSWLVKLILLAVALTVARHLYSAGAIPQAVAGVENAMMRRSISVMTADGEQTPPLIRSGAEETYRWFWDQSDEMQRDVIRRYMHLRELDEEMDAEGAPIETVISEPGAKSISSSNLETLLHLPPEGE